MSEKDTKILIFLISAVLIGVLAIGGYFLFFDQGKDVSAQGLSSSEASQKAMSFINENILAPQGRTASLVSVAEDGSIYKLRIKIDEVEYDSYVTKDGKYLFPDAYSLEEEGGGTNQGAASGQSEPEQRDRPDVKLFVMSYCPFGLQAQKMFLPVYDLLGEKADMSVYFVNYIMHGKTEIDENLNQYCIQSQEPEKYSEYLSCFVQEGKTDQCFTKANVDRNKIEQCIKATDSQYEIYSQYEDESTWLSGSYPKFDVHADLNEKYGVGGSPALVINDKTVQLASRSPEAFKEAVCNAFVSPPQECQNTLSDVAFSAGFGLDEGVSDGGGCGQ